MEGRERDGVFKGLAEGFGCGRQLSRASGYKRDVDRAAPGHHAKRMVLRAPQPPRTTTISHQRATPPPVVMTTYEARVVATDTRFACIHIRTTIRAPLLKARDAWRLESTTEEEGGAGRYGACAPCASACAPEPISLWRSQPSLSVGLVLVIVAECRRVPHSSAASHRLFTTRRRRCCMARTTSPHSFFTNCSSVDVRGGT